MAQSKDLTTEADIDRAMERSREFDTVPRAHSAYYEPSLYVLVLRLTDGHRLIVPREDLPGLEDASASQLSEIEVHDGLNLSWPQLDVDHYIPYLLRESAFAGSGMREPVLAKKEVAAQVS